MELDKMTKEKGIEFTPEQKEAYMLEGGTPHLDGNYTVFGEVIQGMKSWIRYSSSRRRRRQAHEEHKDQVNETHRKISKMENQATETRVLMHTNKGDIKLKLYNDTPLHRDNFIKLVKEGQYNGLLFHRVIKDFMIQGGDVTSKDAPMNKQLGAGDLAIPFPPNSVTRNISIRKEPFAPHVPETK